MIKPRKVLDLCLMLSVILSIVVSCVNNYFKHTLEAIYFLLFAFFNWYMFANIDGNKHD